MISNYPKTSGIYTITNTVDGKMYVGCSVNIRARINKHKTELQCKTHENLHLLRAVEKYGIDKFLFEVLEECEEQFLYSQEHWWATILNVHTEGYNIRGTSPDNKNIRPSLETIKKRSLKLKGMKRSEETKEKQRQSALSRGQKPSEEARRKSIEANKYRKGQKSTRIGWKPTPEHIAAMVAKTKGVPKSKEAREKMSKNSMGKAPTYGNKGKLWTDEMRQRNSGRKHSEETKKKASERLKGKTPACAGYTDKPVIKLNAAGEVIHTYKSTSECVRSIGVPQTTLVRGLLKDTGYVKDGYVYKRK